MSKTYLGIDVPKRHCVFTEIDLGGAVLRRGRFENSFEGVSDFIRSLSPRVELVLEPVLNYLWLLDQIEPYVGSVHVATPHKVRIIAESKSKTDKYDSQMLAELLRINFLPESWAPPYESDTAGSCSSALPSYQNDDNEQEPHSTSIILAWHRLACFRCLFAKGSEPDR